SAVHRLLPFARGGSGGRMRLVDLREALRGETRGRALAVILLDRLVGGAGLVPLLLLLEDPALAVEGAVRVGGNLAGKAVPGLDRLVVLALGLQRLRPALEGEEAELRALRRLLQVLVVERERLIVLAELELRVGE